MQVEDIIKQQKEFHATHNGGVIPDSIDARDYQAEILMGDNLNVVIPSFEQGYNALADCWPDMPNQNQEEQYSCVGRGTSAYKQILWAKDRGEKILFSAKSIYNPIATPGRGAFIRDGLMRTVNYGINKESTVPSGGSEAEVTAPFDFGPYTAEASRYKSLTVASISSQDFLTLAKMIYLNHGFVSGWQTHCQAFIEYGMMQGKRFLKTHGSYGPNSDMYYFEDHVASEPLFSIWTAIDPKNIQNPPTSKYIFNHTINLGGQIPGEKSQDVLELQKFLRKVQPEDNIPLDGVYGEFTRAAVYHFQWYHLGATFPEMFSWGKKVEQKTLNLINKINI